jgi:N-acetylneuraminate synthase
MSTIRIGQDNVGEGHPCFVIAEIGINHNGDLDLAKKLIRAAHDSGVKAVKFQKRTVDVVYSADELERPRESPFGTTNGDLKRGLEFGPAEYAEIDDLCRELGMVWTASCWDEASIDLIAAFKPAFLKIASASLTDDALLLKHREIGVPIILSTGMSSLEQVAHAVEVLGQEDLILLHTTSTYPTDPDEINLLVMGTLATTLGLPIGYSGHEAGILPSIASVALGAVVVERHLTLDRQMWGSDHAVSIEPAELAEMVEGIRSVQRALGKPEKEVLMAEIPVREKLRRVG